MTGEKTWRVEVAWATPAQQVLVEVALAPGASVEQAIRESGVLERFPEIDLNRQRTGIFGEPAALNDAVHDGDRVEIYRPLRADPKEVRRRRAAKAGAGRKPD